MLSKQSVEMLLDLVEIKLSAIIVQDKDDIREVLKLRRCRSELIESKKQHHRNKSDYAELSKMY
ncbi:MAG: hypothetical protein E7015_04265 [Alphaproteobacteria bacterium]|nr:hypothetical protein [Alphaproteobacteria bacterium]